MIKYQKYKYWYTNWNTFNPKKASKNRRLQWWLSIFQKNQIITEYKN